MTIKAITFDFWQTLYKNRSVDYSQRMRRLQAEVEQGSGTTLEQARFEAAVKVARDTWNRTWIEEHRTLNAKEWLLVMLQYLGVSLAEKDLLKIQTRMENTILTDTPILTTEARQVLANLSTHHRLAIISDTGITPGRVLRQVLENDNLIDYFTHLTFSDEVGYSKPHPNAFLTTLEALAVEPAQAVHVGDLLRTDIAGAQRVGMRGVQYVGLSQNQWPQTTNVPIANTIIPDAIIGNHAELAPLLQCWSNAN